MIRARKHLVISALFLLIGIFFMFSSIADITGASIGVASTSSLGDLVIGLGFLGVSFLLFIFGESDLEKKVKSYRRHLEKEEHRKISYEEARVAYEKAEKKYWGNVGKGIIKRGDIKRPLQYIIDPNKPEDK